MGVRGQNRAGSHGNGLSSSREERRVGVYYFYVLDPEFGPGFIKIGTYFPYPAKVWLNGHVRHEAPLNRAEMKGLRLRAVAAAR